MSTINCLFIGGVADGEVRAVSVNHEGDPPAQVQVARTPPIKFGDDPTTPVYFEQSIETYIGERVVDKDGSDWIVYCHSDEVKSPLRMLIEGYRRLPGGRARVDRRT